jgi:hypothetical protein
MKYIQNFGGKIRLENSHLEGRKGQNLLQIASCGAPWCSILRSATEESVTLVQFSVKGVNCQMAELVISSGA